MTLLVMLGYCNTQKNERLQDFRKESQLGRIQVPTLATLSGLLVPVSNLFLNFQVQGSNRHLISEDIREGYEDTPVVLRDEGPR